jgi:hypothetical protein
MWLLQGLNIDNEMKGTENTSKLIFYGEPLNKLIKKDKLLWKTEN